MTAPSRVQLRRTKGWRKPERTIVVARPSSWGNPFRIADCIDAGFADDKATARSVCVTAFGSWLKGDATWDFYSGRTSREWMQKHLADLRGFDLACWCPLDGPCHADVLLERANAPGVGCDHPAERRRPTILNADNPDMRFCSRCGCVIIRFDGRWVRDSVPGQITKVSVR